MIGISNGLAANLACLMEATARKPGNVHRFLDFSDMSYVQFLTSAAAIAPVIERAADRPLGRTILDAVEATRSLVACNTNLGIVLLLAPVAKARLAERSAVADVLRGSTVDDARLVYQAIRRANPGGLGTAPDQDVRDEPTRTLLETMRLAADRDAIARQYAHDFADVFQAVGPLRDRIGRGWNLETAIVATHLDLMAAIPDTLIARKLGSSVAVESSRWAQRVIDSGWPESPGGIEELAALDRRLRGDGNRRNPGATADLVTAVLFAAIRSGAIETVATRWAEPVLEMPIDNERKA